MKNIKTSCSVSQRPQGFQAKPSALQPAFLIFTPKQETTVTGRQKGETAGQTTDYLQPKFTVKVERRKQKQQEEHNHIKMKCLQYGRLK